jgi:hypothetical protein
MFFKPSLRGVPLGRGDAAIQPAFALGASAWLRFFDGPSRSLGEGWVDRNMSELDRHGSAAVAEPRDDWRVGDTP